MNKQEYEKIYHSYASKLRNFAQSFLKDSSSAEEVVQQVFYKIWENKEQLKLDKPFAYLLTATKNEALKEIRRKKRLEENDINATNNLTLTKPDFHEPMIQFEAVKIAIEGLPSKCQEIMKLKVEDGLTHIEIAKFLNISEKTIEKQVTIAFKKIRASLKKYSPFLGVSIIVIILYML